MRMTSWTIYDHPKDYPDVFIAREFYLDRGPEPVQTGRTMMSDNVDELRKLINELYPDKFCFNRDLGDDPVIVETWL